jgi:hypothetical protein
VGPFYCGLNGILSVMESIGATLIAVKLGFHWRWVAGALCDAAAVVAAPALPGRQ